MPNRLSLPRPALIALAALFAGVTFFYSCVWMYYVRHQTPSNPVELGFNNKHQVQYDPATHSVAVLDVVPESPAERAGLRPGDRIVAVKGQLLTTAAPFDQTWAHSRPGDPDGIVGAMNATEEEFGEAALLRILRESRHLDARGLLGAVVAAVQQFSAGEQSDDLTVLVAQAR